MHKKSILNTLAIVNIGANVVTLLKNIYDYKSLNVLIAPYEEDECGSPIITHESKDEADKYTNMINLQCNIIFGSIGHAISVGLTAITLCVNNFTRSATVPIITLGLSATMLLASIAVEKDSLFSPVKFSEPNK